MLSGFPRNRPRIFSSRSLSHVQAPRAGSSGTAHGRHKRGGPRCFPVSPEYGASYAAVEHSREARSGFPKSMERMQWWHRSRERDRMPLGMGSVLSKNGVSQPHGQNKQGGGKGSACHGIRERVSLPVRFLIGREIRCLIVGEAHSLCQGAAPLKWGINGIFSENAEGMVQDRGRALGCLSVPRRRPRPPPGKGVAADHKLTLRAASKAAFRSSSPWAKEVKVHSKLAGER